MTLHHEYETAPGEHPASAYLGARLCLHCGLAADIPHDGGCPVRLEEENAALMARVESAEREAAGLRAMLSEALLAKDALAARLASEREAGRREEREAVVAWMRDGLDPGRRSMEWETTVGDLRRELIVAIERGEHAALRGGKGTT